MSFDDQSGGVGLRKVGIALLGVVLFFAVLGGIMVFSDIEAERMERVARSASYEATTAALSSFRTVRNDCGRCGTDSPVGGWESEDGRSLVLNEDKTFVAFFDDGTAMRGDWSQPGAELCLWPTTGGRTCFSYEQKVDAMKLDDGIYIRR